MFVSGQAKNDSSLVEFYQHFVSQLVSRLSVCFQDVIIPFQDYSPNVGWFVISRETMNAFGRNMGRIVKVFYNKSGQLDRRQVDIASELLNSGAVVAVPTDTVYGLAARIDHTEALNRIYQIKGRDKAKPLAVCVATIDDIETVADISTIDPRIIRSLLPGELTLLLKRKPELNPNLNPGVDTIGIRVPDHNFIKALANFSGPLALTSANKSGECSPILVEEFEELHDKLDCVFDCGRLREILECNLKLDRLGSTVIDLSKKNAFTIVREGCALNLAISVLNRFGYKHLKVSQA